ncbi:MAG: thrombospondin type 3 repeat-containing protein [candidate division Zixibacteria bacterium]|nr:thrombospondin type 3 repeat-containing protein [candidate division Zixibacteria bacterium]
MLLSSTSQSQVCGDMNGNGSINIFDIVSIVHFLHDDGCITSGMQQVPCHESEGDVDGYCGISIGDAMFLSEYVFAGGPTPSACGNCSALPLPISDYDTISIVNTEIPANAPAATIYIRGLHRGALFQSSTVAISFPLELRCDNSPVTIDSIAGFSVNSPAMTLSADFDEPTGNVRITIVDVTAQSELNEFSLSIYVSVTAAPQDRVVEVDTVAAPPLYWPVVVREADMPGTEIELFRPVFVGLTVQSCPDIDSDGVCDSVDNCPSVANPGQEDGNGNGIGDACEIACGDADGSGRIDITDVVHLINYIFAGGLAPQDIAAGDYNCDGKINITDAVYMINYIFAAGPAPCAAC